MNIYLDENQTSRKLAALLQKAGHHVVQPGSCGLLRASDSAQLTYAILNHLIILTKDRTDFKELHELILASGGKHPGMLLIAKEKEPAKNMKFPHVVAAITKVEKSSLALENQVVVLNHWR